MTEEKNKAAVRLFYEQMDRGNLEIVDELVADNCIGHVSGFPEIDGRKELKDLLVVFHSSFPDVRHIIEDLIAEGDKVVARFTLQATHKADYMGIAPTGRSVTYTAIGIYSFENGMQAEYWIEFDAHGLLRQIQ